jgi:hypothetical protein
VPYGVLGLVPLALPRGGVMKALDLTHIIANSGDLLALRDEGSGLVVALCGHERHVTAEEINNVVTTRAVCGPCFHEARRRHRDRAR